MDEKAKVLSGHHRYERGQYVPVQYEHQEWPNWINGVLVNGPEDVMEKTMLPAFYPEAPVPEEDEYGATRVYRRGPGRPRKSE